MAKKNHSWVESASREVLQWLDIDLDALEDRLLFVADPGQVKFHEFEVELMQHMNEVFMAGQEVESGQYACERCGHVQTLSEISDLKTCQHCSFDQFNLIRANVH